LSLAIVLSRISEYLFCYYDVNFVPALIYETFEFYDFDKNKDFSVEDSDIFFSDISSDFV